MFPEELGLDKCGPDAGENLFHWRDRTSETQWPSTSACQGYCSIGQGSLDGATLFSKVVSNKLRGDVRNEITLIYAKCGADVLVNTSKESVTSRKTKWPRFFGPP